MKPLKLGYFQGLCEFTRGYISIYLYLFYILHGHPFWRGSDDVPDLPKPRVMEDAIRLIPRMLQGVKNLTDHTGKNDEE